MTRKSARLQSKDITQQTQPLADRERPAVTGTVHKWRKRAPRSPFTPGLDSTALVAELRAERLPWERQEEPQQSGLPKEETENSSPRQHSLM